MVKQKPKLNLAEIRELLRLKGWSQAELARQLGITAGAVTMWLKGTHVPGGPTQKLLRQWLDEARTATSKVEVAAAK